MKILSFVLVSSRGETDVSWLQYYYLEPSAREEDDLENLRGNRSSWKTTNIGENWSVLLEQILGGIGNVLCGILSPI